MEELLFFFFFQIELSKPYLGIPPQCCHLYQLTTFSIRYGFEVIVLTLDT